MRPYHKENRILFSDPKTKAVLVASFLMPVFLLLLMAWKFKIFPFGTDCFMTESMQNEYLPVITEFRRKIVSGESLFYTWNAGGGSSFWTRVACYSASPFNLLFACFSENAIPKVIQLVFALKCASASLAFATLLWKKENVVSPLTVGLSTAYGLSGFVLTYSQEPWVLDLVILLPLLVLTLYFLIQGRHSWTFAVTCAITALTVCEAGIYVLLFVLSIFPLLYVEQRHTKEGTRHFGSVLKDFFIYLFLGVAASAFLWYPALRALWNGAPGTETLHFPDDLAMDLKVWDILERAGFDSEVLFPSMETQLPSVYCGIFTVILSILYGFSSKIAFSEKIYTGSFLVVTYIGMSNKIIQFGLHGLHSPISGAYPQAILLTFMIVYMAGRLIGTGELFQDKVHLWTTLSFLIVFMLVRSKISKELDYADYAVYGAVLLMVLYFSISSRMPSLSGRKCSFGAVALMVVMLAESGLSFYHPIKEKYYQLSTKTTDMPFDSKNLRETVADGMDETTPPKRKKVYALSDNVLYKKPDEKWTSMMNQIRGKLPSGSHLIVLTKDWDNEGMTENISTWNEDFYLAPLDFADTLRKLGINEGEKGAILLRGGTPVTDIFFNTPLYLANDFGDMSLTEHKTAGANAFFTSSIDIYENIFRSPSHFTNQNELAYRFSEVFPFDDIAMQLQKSENVNEETDGQLSAQNGEKGIEALYYSTDAIYTPIYINCSCDLTGGLEILRVDENGNEFFLRRISLPQNTWVEVGGEELRGDRLGVRITAQNPQKNKVHLAVASMEPETLQKYQENMVGAAWTNEQRGADWIGGTINAPIAGHVVLNVPYEEGWEATVDGQKTRVFAGFDTFVAVNVPSGRHVVEFRYRPQGFQMGACVSCGALGLLVLLSMTTYLTKNKKKSEKKPEPEMPAEENPATETEAQSETATTVETVSPAETEMMTNTESEKEKDE